MNFFPSVTFLQFCIFEYSFFLYISTFPQCHFLCSLFPWVVSSQERLQTLFAANRRICMCILYCTVHVFRKLICDSRSSGGSFGDRSTVDYIVPGIGYMLRCTQTLSQNQYQQWFTYWNGFQLLYFITLTVCLVGQTTVLYCTFNLLSYNSSFIGIYEDKNMGVRLLVKFWN